jgi:hypothetical protein
LKTQLENHKEALYSLYGTHEKLRKQYRHLCNIVCDKLEETEDYIAQRAQQSHLLESREGEIFQLWERIKDLEQYKSSREEVEGEEEEEEGLEVENPTKRIKSQETDDSRIRRSSFDSASDDSLQQQLAHKRKHHETIKDTSSPRVVATMKSQTKSSDQEDMFYQQHKGFSVDLDLLLPQKLSAGKGKVAMMGDDNDEEEEERAEEFSPPLTFSSRKKDQMSDEEQEMRNEEEGEEEEQETIESLVDANPEDELEDEEFGEEEMEEEHPPKELEELQESPIYKQTRDQSTGDDEDNLEDSADSLFGLNAALSPVLNSDYFNKTVTQNLFGKDESPQVNQMEHFKSQDVDHSNEPNEDEESDDMLLEITKSNDGSHLRSTGGKSLPLFSLSKSAANISARKFIITESSTQTDSLASTTPLMSPKPPTRSHTIQTDVIPSRDAWAQVKLAEEEKKPPTPSSSNRLSPIPFKSFGKDAACQVELILPTPPPTPTVAVPVPVPAVPAVAVSSDLKKKKPADAPVVSQKSVFDKEQLEIDSNYIQDMEVVHYTVGETLVNLEFEKERALKHFKSKMKHLLLSSAVKGGGKEISTSSPDYHEMKDKKREVLQEMSPAESKEEGSSSLAQQPITSSTFPYNITEKELFEKQLFTYKEKVFYLEKEKEQKEEEINLLKLNYSNEKNLLEVQVQELTKRNKEFIYLMNEMKKPTKEMSIQTDNTGKKKKYQMKIHHYGEQQEESESEIDSGQEDGEDELSRLLFKEVNRSNSKFLNKSKMGKMEIFQPTDEKGEEEEKKRSRQVSAANSLFQEVEEEHDQHSSDEENLVPQNSSLRSLPSLNNSTILLDGSNLDYEEDQQDQQQQNISKLSLNETFPEQLQVDVEEEDKQLQLLVPQPTSPSTTLIRIPTPGQKNRRKFFEETEIAAVVQQSSPSLQKKKKSDPRLTEASSSSAEEMKGDQSYEELFQSRPATTTVAAPATRSSFPSSFPTAHQPPQSSQKESNSSNSSVNTSIFIKEHTYEHTGFITNYELYEDDHSNRNQHQSTTGKSADGSRRSSIATVEEEEESEEEEKEGEEQEEQPSEYREMETTENKFGFDSSSYDEYLQKNFQDLENDFEKELLAIKEENSSMMMGKEGIAFNDYDEMQEEEKDWSNKFEQKQQRQEKEKQEMEEFLEKQRRTKERMKEDHEEKEFEANIHRILSATDKLNDHKQFIEKVNDTTNPKVHETGGMMRSPVANSSLSPKHYEIQDYSLLSSDYQQKLEDLKLKKAALLLAAASEEKKSPSPKSHRKKYNNNQTVALVDEENKLNLESFEVMRIEWENQQLLNKQQELIRENQVIRK